MIMYMKMDLNFHSSYCFQGDKEIAETLIQNGADPTIVAEDESTAHSIAVSTGRKVVALLIAEGCVVHGIIADNPDAIGYGIEHGAFADVPTRSGWTALMYASANGNTELVSFLLQNGANPNRQEVPQIHPRLLFIYLIVFLPKLVVNCFFLLLERRMGRSSLRCA